MKVLFLANLPSPYRAIFFAELGKLCDLTVIYERRSASDRDKKWKAETENTYRAIFLNGKEIGTDNSFCPEILKYLKAEKYDRYIVGMYSTYTAMLAITLLKQKKIPFILSTDGGFIAQESRIKYLIKRHFIGAANYWLSTGAAATDYLVHYGADREKIYIYPFTSLTENDLADGRRIGKLDKELLKEELGIRENKMVLAVGQFIYRKGMDILLRALPKMQKDFVIYIIGGTATEEYWSLLNEDDKQRVHFLNFMAKEELARYYRAADVFVLPTREDIWGLVINEALSYLVPCITTEKCGAGLALIEPGKNGMIIPVDDVDELTSAITEVSTWEGNQTKLNCLASIKEYSIENMAKRHYEVFQKMQ